jgi:predicted transcriptional regulator of viral defense system
MATKTKSQLDLLDSLVARGQNEFTFHDAHQAWGTSVSAAANTLRRLGEKGLVDKLVRGHYAIRPLGSLGTAAATEDLGLAVGTAFEGYPHRIAYASALSELGLLSHPVRTAYVACTKQVRFTTVSRRPLRVVIEQPKTIHLEAEKLGKTWWSSLERALFESAMRVDLVGTVERLAEALAVGAREAKPTHIKRLSKAFGARGLAAERRMASLADALDLPLALEPEVGKRRPIIRLDPRDDEVVWTDARYRVAWNRSVDELRAVTQS